MPCQVALNKTLNCGDHVRVFPLKHDEDLFVTMNDISCKSLKSLLQTDPFNMAIIFDQDDLVSRLIKFFIEREKIVHEHHNGFNQSDGGCYLNK